MGMGGNRVEKDRYGRGKGGEGWVWEGIGRRRIA